MICYTAICAGVFMNKIAAICMLKNEDRYVYGDGDVKPTHTMIRQYLEHLRSFVDGVFIWDDFSTDESIKVYAEYKRLGFIKYIIQDKRIDQNETLTFLTKKALEAEYDWLLCLDCDEILEDSARKFIRDFTNTHDYKDEYSVRFNYVNLWRSRKRYRTDRWYNSDTTKFFSLTDRLVSLGTSYNNHHFVFGEEGNFGRIVRSHLKILHYAWVDWSFLLAKVESYTQREMYYKQCTRKDAEWEFICVTDEVNATFETVKPEWQEEFRSGVIRYGR